MKIEKEKYVNIDYVLKNDQGEIVDSSEGGESLGYIHGVGALIPGLESALEGQAAGAELSVTVTPEDAYGVHKPELVEEVPLQDLQGIQNLHEGMQLQAQTPYGVQTYTVLKISDTQAVMDGNHPLAGQNLHFNVKINSIREATEDELASLSHQCCGGHDHEHEHDGGSCGSGNGGGCGCN
jgi:FKBP-type peptidyl-prolyl cis-trans isomerase SlyD